jgi:aerobic carbon-monoxide dehydrogenase medium subunit
MTPKKFDYYRASDLSGAVDFLSKNPGSKILAGGQSLIALMKLRLAEPSSLLDIGKIKDLSYIKRDGDEIAIGALTTHAEVEESELLREYCSILPQMASQIGDQQVRNLGTLGGSLVHADPSGDPPAAVLALDGSVKAVGPSSERTIPISEFFQGTFATALEHNEILTEIRVPALDRTWSSTYQKYAWREGDFAIVGFAGALQLAGPTVKKARIAFASMAEKPIRASKLEGEIVNKDLTKDSIEKFAELATAESDPPSDVHASAEFRLNVAKQLVKRYLNSTLSKMNSQR